MRIIGGNFKGRTIKVPKGFDGRPTTDFAREGLFNILQHIQPPAGLKVLDLFSGTGAFSLECLSRGADSAVAIDIQTTHIKGIQANFQEFAPTSSRTIRADVFRWLSQPQAAFDLILADPPFDHVRLSDLPDLILSCGILSPEGLLIFEHPDSLSFESHPKFLRHRAFGHVNFSFFRH